MNHKKLNIKILESLPEYSLPQSERDKRWLAAVQNLRKTYEKVIILDDDPTGSQTVYDLPVYTGFDHQSLQNALNDISPTVYILTNSRSLSALKTEELHRRLGRDLKAMAPGELLVISRSDSTLRGHYPLETEALAAALEPEGLMDGEILIPFFPEGGRFTLKDIHYVREGEFLVPAAQTEFAKDSSFAFHSSDLKDYVQEKTQGKVLAKDVLSIPLELLRKGDLDSLRELLFTCTDYQRVIVNTISYEDLKVFFCAFSELASRGKRFIFRSAAAFVRVLAGLDARPFLTKKEMLSPVDDGRPGLVIAGSYVGKSRRQLQALFDSQLVEALPFNVRSALDQDSLEREISSLSVKLRESLLAGQTPCLYTDNPSGGFLSASESSEGLTDLEFSARISSSLVRIVRSLDIRPSFILSKGGITSHDMAVHALEIQRAEVLGQAAPGIPVWRCAEESRFPGIPYVIFPGNVGQDDTLLQVVRLFLLV
ncbi:hydroxyacid dehydrogenase [Oceanispirochaeta crateris]|uniref:Hydroxyacid dehydrogenase n=1 Tax=Oceanispirochaeta crateris TaxID=2518645 RepID=A0A5C1QQR0_9SPIO|nr:four-carbon acid sugar kinase family protein [Oceanispirochaeta crateris]QEN08954.1 hydroxyacid dehydrogenase [Oceanispirochaeta crateris]